MNHFPNESIPKQPYYPEARYGEIVLFPSKFSVHVAAPVLADGIEHMSLDDMEYDGTLGDVVSQIDFRLEAPASPAIVLSAARLIRAIIDAKIVNPDTEITFDEVRSATNLALDIFRGTANRASLYNFVQGNLPLSTPVLQKSDSVTHVSTQPGKICAAAAHLAETAGDQDVLFLSLCHGGLIAGAGTYLTREHSRPYGNSLFYPVRFSRYKCGDMVPNLTAEEIARLTQEASARKVVVFDEDMCSGETARTAQEYFSRLFGLPVICITTNDMTVSFNNFAEKSLIKNDKDLHENFKKIIVSSEIINSKYFEQSLNQPYIQILNTPENNSSDGISTVKNCLINNKFQPAQKIFENYL